MQSATVNSSVDILKRYSSDAELARSLPTRPIFPTEYRLLQFGQGNVIILGAGSRQIITCSLNINDLKSTLKLMDGSRTIEEIVSDVKKSYSTYLIERDDIFSLICSLHDLGMFEEAKSNNRRDNSIKGSYIPENTQAFLGRMCGPSGMHHNRHEMWEKLRSTKVFIIGNSNFSQALEKNFIQAGINTTTERKSNTVVVLYNNEKDLDSAKEKLSSIKKINGNILDVLFLGFTPEGLFIGPLTNSERSDRFFCWLVCFLKGGTLSIDSSRRFDDMERQMSDKFYTHFSTSVIFNLIAGIGDAFIYECVNIIASSYDSPAVEQRSFSLSSYVSPNEIPEHYSKEKAFEVLMVGAWFSGAEIPPPKYISPRVHRKHYAAANIALTKEKNSIFYGVKRVKFEQLSKVCEMHSIDQESLAVLCKLAFGEEKEKRLTPTGGDLRSTEAILLISPNPAESDKDLDAGIYRYCSGDSRLELIANFPKEYFDLGLNGIHLVVASRYQKIYEKYYAGTFKIINLDAGVAYTAARWVAEHFQLQLQLCVECDLKEVEKHIPLPFGEGRYSASSVFCLTKSLDNNNTAHEDSRKNIEIEPDEIDNSFSRTWLDEDKSRFDSLHIDRYLLEFSKKRLVNAKAGTQIRTQAINETQNSEELLRLIRSRRAHRVFESTPLDVPLMEDYMIKADNAVKHAVPGISDCMLNYWVMDQLRNKLIYFDSENGLFQYSELKQVRVFNQELLSFSPAAMVVGIPVKRVAMEYGAAGLKYAIQCCGAALYNVWLNAEKDGLRACIAGGIIPESFSSIVSDGLSEIQPIASICWGRELRT